MLVFSPLVFFHLAINLYTLLGKGVIDYQTNVEISKLVEISWQDIVTNSKVMYL